MGARTVNISSILKSALVVVGGGIAAAPASALELGDVKIHSTLGQPLQASIAYALGPNEALSKTCVTLPRTGGTSGLPKIGQSSLSVTDGVIAITGSSIVREPLLSMRLNVSCNYTPLLTRDYLMFIDPAGATPIAAPTPDRIATQPQLQAPPVRRAPVSLEPIAEPSFSADDPAVVADVVEPVAALAEPVAVVTAYEPGDVILISDNPYVEPVVVVAEESVVIPDTRIEEPQSISISASTSTAPNVPVNIIQPAKASEPSASNWLLWLGGGGGAIALALLLFGRSFRDRFGSAPIAPVVPKRSATDGVTQEIEAIADDSPTSENLTLDADLIIGTGLQEGTDVDVSQDFGFAATTELDLELPEERFSDAETPETDILPPLGIDESSILKSEILPQDDDYHMSVIVDATKMPMPEDVTERDLAAVQIDTQDETLIPGDYTVSQEVDYKVIEQDYEDEMTTTQALNAEILKAAEEVAVAMDDTAEKPLATIHELDVTAQMPAEDQVQIGDDDDTGVNPTVNMEV